MCVLIVGYGYVGYHLAQALLNQGETVIAWSRSMPALLPKNKAMSHYTVNCIDKNVKLPEQVKTIFYCAPPPANSADDTVLQKFLNKAGLSNITSIVYFSSSSVYGNHHGYWVTENSALQLSSHRQKIRADAEHQLTHFCLTHKINLSILRVAGIYGLNRLPLEKARAQAPLIRKEEAPIVNLIYVNDLVDNAIKLSKKVTGQMIFNISDSVPLPWGETQRIICDLLCMKIAPEVSYADYWQQASPRLQEFLLNNKKLSTDKIRGYLGETYISTPLKSAIKKLIK